MSGFILRRLLQAIPVILVVITATFFMVRAAPGGPFDQERSVSPAVLESLSARYNLDAPLWQQYTDYLGNLMRGDFGASCRFASRSVNDIIAAGFPVTLELSICALLIAIVIAMSAGILASLRPNT